MTDGDERRLVRRLQQRDEEAFREMVTLYQHKVLNLVFRLLGDYEEAQDLSQEVFVAVFKHIDAFRGDARFSTWLYRIATNLCMNRLKYLRRRARDRTQPLTETHEGEVNTSPLVNHSPTPEKLMAGHQLELAVQKAMANLSEEYRTLIVLRDTEHMAYADIATITGLNEGTVKSRLHRARAALKIEVNRYYETD